MPDIPPHRTGERIAKLLARAGIASRREVERMIAEGRVKLGEEVLTTPATVLPSLAGVSVDGQPVRAAEAARLFLFHKPDGLITAERDPAGRPTIYTALRNALPPGTPRVMPVGRLDFSTEGLLLLTNDGALKRALELPSTGIPRTYRARTFGEISQAQLDDLIEGVEIAGVRYGKIDANLERSAGRNRWVEMTITEGKNREVRRVLEYLGLQVSRLIRTAYGQFLLGDLPRGAAVEAAAKEVEKLRVSLGLPADPRAALPVRPTRASPRKTQDARPSPLRADDARASPRSADDARASPRRAEPAKTKGGPVKAKPFAAQPSPAKPQTEDKPRPARPVRPVRKGRPEPRPGDLVDKPRRPRPAGQKGPAGRRGPRK
jgi:23S rRNA pseudouridine2605 synthase